MKKIFLILILLLFFYGCAEKQTAMDLYNEGRSLLSTDPNLALEKFNEAIKLDENFSEAYERRSSVLEGMGKYHDSEVSALRAIEIWPDNYRAYLHLGLIYFKKGDLEKSLFYLKEAEKINPFDVFVNNNLAAYYFFTNNTIGDCKKAIPYAKKYLESVITDESMIEAIEICESES